MFYTDKMSNMLNVSKNIFHIWFAIQAHIFSGKKRANNSSSGSKSSYLVVLKISGVRTYSVRVAMGNKRLFYQVEHVIKPAFVKVRTVHKNSELPASLDNMSSKHGQPLFFSE